MHFLAIACFRVSRLPPFDIYALPLEHVIHCRQQMRDFNIRINIMKEYKTPPEILLTEIIICGLKSYK